MTSNNEGKGLRHVTADSLDITELLDQWNNRSTPDQTATVPELFAAQCAATPDAVAVVAR